MLNRGIEGRFQIVMSEFILTELVAVLRQPRFKTSEDEIHAIVRALMQSSEVVRVESKFKVVKTDPNDDVILNTA